MSKTSMHLPISGVAGTGSQSPSSGVSFADLYALTKPRITYLNTITAFAALWVATGGQPTWAMLIAALFGTAFSVASGGVLNSWVERDRDRLMKRTAKRPLPAGRVDPRLALRFGIGLGVAGVTVLAALASWLSAAIALFGIVFYVVIYTAWLKGSTHWNTVLGSVAGSIPPLIGWTVGSGALTIGGLVIAGIVFLWQSPHFWALSLSYEEDYRNAGIKMLPVTHGQRVTKQHIMAYNVMFVAATAVAYALGLAGVVYLIVSMLLGGVLLVYSYRNLRAPDLAYARPVFHFSNLYLAAIFLLLIFDCGTC